MRTFFFIIALFVTLMVQPAYAGKYLCVQSPIKFDKPVFGLSVIGPYDAPFWQSVDELQVKWLRAEVRWDEIEKKKGKYDFAIFDNLIVEASNRSVRLLVTFDHPPKWATANHALFLARLQAVSAAMAIRSAGMVAAWEVFNEPNMPGHGWPFQLDIDQNAVLYATAVKAMGSGIRTSGHREPIVAGALSPEGQPAEDFMKKFVGIMPCACFDIISVHPYGRIGQLASTQKDAEKKLQAAAGYPVNIWFTELGYTEVKTRGAMLGKALAESKDVRGLFWSTLRDPDGTYGYGLTTSDNSRKPEFDQVKDWLKK